MKLFGATIVFCNYWIDLFPCTLFAWVRLLYKDSSVHQHLLPINNIELFRRNKADMCTTQTMNITTYIVMKYIIKYI